MLPLSDSVRTRRPPVVNLTLIALNVLVFLYELSLGPRLDLLLDRYGIIPARIMAALADAPGANRWVLVTLITATFLHAGWLHLVGNMLFLWIFGDNVEDRLGHATYLFFYLTCGILANLAEAYALPGSTVPGIGASGAIAGVLGAYFITYPGATISVALPVFFLFSVVDVPALIMIGMWFISQFFSGVASLGAPQQSGGIAWWAHVGGFLAGMALMTILPKSHPTVQDDPTLGAIERARRDTGLVGLFVGTTSLVSQLLEIVILIRLVIVFIGRPAVHLLRVLLPATLHLIALTDPLVRPFAFFAPPLRVAGHVLELYDLLAVLAYYLIGSAIIWFIAWLAFGGRDNRRDYRRSHGFLS